MRRLRRGVRPGDHTRPAGALAGQRADAEHLAGCPRRRPRLPESSVPDDCRRRRRDLRGVDLHPEHRCGLWLCDRRDPVRLCRLHRHERLGARQFPCRRGRPWRHLARAEGRLPGWRDHGHARCRARPVRACRLLRPAHSGVQRLPEDGRGRAHRPRLRRFLDLRVRSTRRRHLHEGAPTSAPISSARSRPASPRTIPATRP